MSICPNPSGLLTINDIVLESECWVITSDLVPMWFIQNFIEGPSVHIPGASGNLSYTVDIGPARFPLRFMIIGSCDPDGVPYDDAYAGLASNINLFRTEVLDPITTNSGLQAATLSVPDGSTRVADVFVEPWEPGTTVEGTVGLCDGSSGDGSRSVMHRGILPVRVPAGQFVTVA